MFRSGVTGYHEPDGILFDDISAKVDCSDDDMFPPEASRLRVTYYVIRKSDGRVAILGTDSTFGTHLTDTPSSSHTMCWCCMVATHATMRMCPVLSCVGHTISLSSP